MGTIPTVLLNCHTRKDGLTSFVPADFAGAYAATETLLKAGHRRIAHVAGETWMEAGKDRDEGYRQALTNWDVPIDLDIIRRGDTSMQGGRQAAHQLLDLPQPPTAIFCFTDRMALGVYDAIHGRGLRIPEDISVIGFDNEEDLAAKLDPPLSTVVLPHDEMARRAVHALLELVENAAPPPPRLNKIECPLILRDSVAGPKPISTVRQSELNLR